MRSVFVVVVVVMGAAGCKSSTPLDRERIPARDYWCCEGEVCFAAKDTPGLPDCANRYFYGLEGFSLSDRGYKRDGVFHSCTSILKAGLAEDPKLLERDPGYAMMPPGQPHRELRSCLTALKGVDEVTRKPHAYAVSYFDKREEKDLWYAYSSKYYCDKAREERTKDDGIGSLSVCEKVEGGL